MFTRPNIQNSSIIKPNNLGMYSKQKNNKQFTKLGSSLYLYFTNWTV